MTGHASTRRGMPIAGTGQDRTDALVAAALSMSPGEKAAFILHAPGLTREDIHAILTADYQRGLDRLGHSVDSSDFPFGSTTGETQ